MKEGLDIVRDNDGHATGTDAGGKVHEAVSEDAKMRIERVRIAEVF